MFSETVKKKNRNADKLYRDNVLIKKIYKAPGGSIGPSINQE